MTTGTRASGGLNPDTIVHLSDPAVRRTPKNFIAPKMSNRKIDVEEKKAANLYSTHDVSKAITEFLEEVCSNLSPSAIFNRRLYRRLVGS